jgi:hypothetical protein
VKFIKLGDCTKLTRTNSKKPRIPDDATFKGRYRFASV